MKKMPAAKPRALILKKSALGVYTISLAPLQKVLWRASTFEKTTYTVLAIVRDLIGSGKPGREGFLMSYTTGIEVCYHERCKRAFVLI